jgi:hypothetical protein
MSVSLGASTAPTWQSAAPYLRRAPLWSAVSPLLAPALALARTSDTSLVTITGTSDVWTTLMRFSGSPTQRTKEARSLRVRCKLC